MIGTVIGTTVIVALTAFFSQDRIAFLGLLALWGGLCAFAATGLRNFASYSASLAGYTAAMLMACCCPALVRACGAARGPDRNAR